MKTLPQYEKSTTVLTTKVGPRETSLHVLISLMQRSLLLWSTLASSLTPHRMSTTCNQHMSLAQHSTFCCFDNGCHDNRFAHLVQWVVSDRYKYKCIKCSTGSKAQMSCSYLKVDVVFVPAVLSHVRKNIFHEQVSLGRCIRERAAEEDTYNLRRRTR